MDLKQYVDSLDPDARDAYARRAGTTLAYLYQLTGGHRAPSPQLAKRLHAESGNRVKLAKLRPDIWARIH